jgi:hypothetical protein
LSTIGTAQISFANRVTRHWFSSSLEMQDCQASIEKLRKDAAEAALIRDLATDKTKREVFSRLHEHLNRLADDVKRAMIASATK